MANRLKDLADALDREGTAIRANFSRWDGTLNLVQLAQQAAEVRKNAKDMSLRADLAANLLRQGNISFCGVKGDMVNVPWDTKDINTAQEAQEEAAALKKALDNPKDPASRATITEIAQSMGRSPGRSGLYDLAPDPRWRQRHRQGRHRPPRAGRDSRRGRPQ
ncbi:hypothetical protein [Streptomyces sp. SPB162]|uniref:hypothetical protein n=1 Tax=Streptomyces sp. SPB162 TaxID=2940560 RepID=UPI00240497C1|nr:hypothetical protein [Streptomyces sp. SPB162]